MVEKFTIQPRTGFKIIAEKSAIEKFIGEKPSFRIKYFPKNVN